MGDYKYYIRYDQIFVEHKDMDCTKNFWRNADHPNTNGITRFPSVPSRNKYTEISQEEANRICKKWYTDKFGE